MQGWIVTYKPNTSIDRVKLNHELFGRIIYRNYRGKKYVYYSPGILHDAKFYRLTGGKIFTDTYFEPELLTRHGQVTIVSGERDESEMLLMTGKDYWERIAKEKGLHFKQGGKK